MPLVPTPRRELLAAGTELAAIKRDLRAGRTVAPFHGVHLDAAAAVGRMTRIRAAVATQAPTARVGMQTAAVLHRLRWLPQGWFADDATVQFAVEQDDGRRHRGGIRLHRRALAPEDTVFIDGIACLSVTRTLVELARDPKIQPLLVVQIIDGALRDGRTTKEALFACLARFPGERGVARARRLVARSREGVDSPPETTMRLLLEDGGITELEVGIRIYDDSNGDVLARGDLGIELLLIWGEYDGFVPHTERETFRKDRPHRRWIGRRGWNVLPFVDTDLAQPAALCREWRAAIADAPARIASLDPRRSPEVAAARKALGLDS